jgi:methylphosphotriester-DNA--protein-cysteine methyltransferase
MASITVIQRKSPSIEDRKHQFEELCTWIVGHLDDQLGWQELMAQSGLDHYTLNALFFRFTASTPMAWIRRQRSQREGNVVQLPVGLSRLRRAQAAQA